MDVVPEIGWANLPDPALLTLFKNMAVTDLIRVAFQVNKKWNNVASSNLIWKDKYERLYYQEEVQIVLAFFEQTQFNPLLEDDPDRFAPISRIAFQELRDYMRNGKRRTKPGEIPSNYFFVHFLLIWTSFPHIWREKNGQWLNVSFVSPKFIPVSLDFFRNDFIYPKFRRYIELQDCLTWLRVKGKYFFIRSSAVEFCYRVKDGRNRTLYEEGRCNDAYNKHVDLYFDKDEGLIIANGKVLSRDQYVVITEQNNQLVDIAWASAHRIVNFTGTNNSPTFNPFTLIWYHNNDSDTRYDLMGCSVCGIETQLVCGGCEQRPYCSQDCQTSDFHQKKHRCWK